VGVAICRAVLGNDFGLNWASVKKGHKLLNASNGLPSAYYLPQYSLLHTGNLQSLYSFTAFWQSLSSWLNAMPNRTYEEGL
jgi:hypothetical protein